MSNFVKIWGIFKKVLKIFKLFFNTYKSQNLLDFWVKNLEGLLIKMLVIIVIFIKGKIKIVERISENFWKILAILDKPLTIFEISLKFWEKFQNFEKNLEIYKRFIRKYWRILRNIWYFNRFLREFLRSFGDFWDNSNRFWESFCNFELCFSKD